MGRYDEERVVYGATGVDDLSGSEMCLRGATGNFGSVGEGSPGRCVMGLENERWMDGWNGWMDGWMEWMDGWMDGMDGMDGGTILSSSYALCLTP